MVMVNKKFMVFLCLIFFVGMVSAETITSYVVPYTVMLGQPVTATGIYDGNTGTLCSFYLRDADTNAILERATDQYTTGTGRFTMTPFPINEPTFKRDSNYNVLSECGLITADANFTVSQRETLSHVGGQEFDYITQPENLDTIIIWVIMILLIISFVGLGVFLIKYGRGK